MEERVLFEIDSESQCRSLPAANANCLEYFGRMPGLRSVILIKVMRRQVDDYKVAIVGVLYRCGAHDPMIADAVFFGTRPLAASDTTAEDVALLLRCLPVAQYSTPRCGNPWIPGQRQHITIPAEEIPYIWSEHKAVKQSTISQSNCGKCSRKCM
jgi:hypothetical protein